MDANNNKEAERPGRDCTWLGNCRSWFRVYISRRLAGRELRRYQPASPGRREARSARPARLNSGGLSLRFATLCQEFAFLRPRAATTHQHREAAELLGG
jgi:hypothetical protein